MIDSMNIFSETKYNKSEEAEVEVEVEGEQSHMHT